MSSVAIRIKPAKPYPDFPLFAHASGQWAKKIRGKTRYFGPWGDPDGALQRYQTIISESPDCQLLIGELCQIFLSHKQAALDAGKLRPRSWHDLYHTCNKMTQFFGAEKPVLSIKPTDFRDYRAHLADTRKAISLGHEITKVRSIFNFAFNPRLPKNLIPNPIDFGDDFNPPSELDYRRTRRERPSRMIESPELREIIDNARPILRAMILLGINCGMRQRDVANLTLSAINLDAGWLNNFQTKTCTYSRCKLWPETVEALREAIALRPFPEWPAQDAELVFLTRLGQKWTRENIDKDKRIIPIDSIGNAFTKLLRSLGLKRAGGFCNLRATFRTVISGAKDEVAAGVVMGHIPCDAGALQRNGPLQRNGQPFRKSPSLPIFPPKITPS